MKRFVGGFLTVSFVLGLFVISAGAGDVKRTDVYKRLKKQLDAVRAIDTHSHLRGPSQRAELLGQFRSKPSTNSALFWVWRRGYYTGGHPMKRWPADGDFGKWWAGAQSEFQNSRARSAYRTMLPIFTDLYGVDFETLTPEQAKELDERMEKTYEDPDWGEKVIRRRANTELVIVDSYWRPMNVRDHYPFTVSTLNTNVLIHGFHPSEFAAYQAHDLYAFAAKRNLPVKSLDDYIAVLDRIFVEAKKAGAVCVKNASAYDRTLQFDRVSKTLAAKAFGRPRKELSPERIKAFEDYVFWRLAELAAKHDLPFQVHTGHAKIEGSNPMNLVNVIAANPKTKFILFHGGFPWVSESGAIALRYPNVWLDSVWMPVLSYEMGKRGYKEWLDMISSDRIMWGSDMATVDGTYGTTVYTRQCITEALAEKVVAGELRESDALRIGRQILRENALKMFPTIRERVESMDKR
ncbi:MAG: amidohydrolase family protein [Pirellulales bacterium]|nr:amidohydrolase family protein [Pirellulales bacterium]